MGAVGFRLCCYKNMIEGLNIVFRLFVFVCQHIISANADIHDKLISALLHSVPDHGWDPNTDCLAVQTEDRSQVQKRWLFLSFLFFLSSCVQIILLLDRCAASAAFAFCNLSIKWWVCRMYESDFKLGFNLLCKSRNSGISFPDFPPTHYLTHEGAFYKPEGWSR